MSANGNVLVWDEELSLWGVLDARGYPLCAFTPAAAVTQYGEELLFLLIGHAELPPVAGALTLREWDRRHPELTAEREG
jgi:hypothetical protein